MDSSEIGSIETMKRKPLKLPPDFFGNVKAFLNTPPPPKRGKKAKKKAKG